MTPARWRQIEELYEAVRTAGPEIRAALLAGADAEVRRAVGNMLDQPSAETPLDQPAWAAQGVSTPPLAIGAMLGPYRIESPIGSGGMGVVYKAEDTRLRRFVAAEFQKILDHRAIVSFDPIGALTHLQIGRAFAAAGDKAKAKGAYAEFLKLWEQADSALPILQKARSESAQ